MLVCNVILRGIFIIWIVIFLFKNITEFNCRKVANVLISSKFCEEVGYIVMHCQWNSFIANNEFLDYLQLLRSFISEN